MRNISTALLVSSLFFVSPVTAYAHGSIGHHGTISATEIAKKATEKVQSLVESGKLDKSWADVQYDKVTSNGKEWVVTFINNKISDKAKQTLHVFMGDDGTYIATNFTGK